MERNEILSFVNRLFDESPGNYISKEQAINPEYEAMRIYDAPVFAFGSADDDLFNEYKSSSVIGAHFMTPFEWLPEAKTVISFFLPYTDRIKLSNRADNIRPSDEWLHGRYEGQLFLRFVLQSLEAFLNGMGYKTIAPSNDTRFKTGSPDQGRFTSNWSERHAAFACGLGTFGLSKGIITDKGMCGRLGSVITSIDLPKDNKPYSDVYEYCTKCGACINRCPVGCISAEEGKKHQPCSDFLDKVKEDSAPRYGCGKCQTGVPCESRIPAGKGSLRS